MKNTKATKRALLSSIFAMLLCAAMLVGTTFAWFTDSASTAVNKIQAGTLDVQLLDEGGNSLEGETLQWKKAAGGANEEVLWEPGCTYELQPIVIKNAGNLALKYKIVISGILGDAELNEAIEWTINDTDLASDHPLAAGEFATLTIKGHMKESAGNEYQGLSIDGIGITVVATQDTVEYDSYDNQYDKNAHPDAVFGSQILANLNDPDVAEVVVGENIDMNLATFQQTNGNKTYNIPDGKTLDMNNNSIIRPDGGNGNGLPFKNGVTATVKNGSVINEGDMTAVDIEYGANVTFESMKFVGHGDDAVRIRASGAGDKTTAVFKNCIFENAGVIIKGMNGAAEIDIRFIGCTFTGTYFMYGVDGNKLTDKHGNVHYTSNLITTEYANNLYGDIVIDDCTFDYDAHEASYAKSAIFVHGCSQDYYPGKMLNVTLNNINLTTQNAKPVEIDSRDTNGLNIVETGTNSYEMDGIAVNYKGETA